MSVEITVKVNDAVATQALAPLVAAFVSQHETRGNLPKDATDAQKATALLTLILKNVVDDPDNPGSHFGDFKRKLLGQKRGLGRDLTFEEWRAEGDNAIRAAAIAAVTP